MSIGAAIDRIIATHSLLKKEFAASIGRDATTISYWYSGRTRPDAGSLRKILEVYGGSFLFDGSDEICGWQPGRGRDDWMSRSESPAGEGNTTGFAKGHPLPDSPRDLYNHLDFAGKRTEWDELPVELRNAIENVFYDLREDFTSRLNRANGDVRRILLGQRS
jgi:transcriptional regulator with XRE-family HTH domain